MKIINFTDVITNSSSEVFTFYDKSTISIIKDAVNGILSLVDSEHNFDDYFTIKLDIDESIYDRYPDTEYKDFNITVPNKSFDELSKVIPLLISIII